MKKRTTLLMLVAMAVMTLGAVSAFAETEVKADVPFPFYAGVDKLPAGNYLFIWGDPNESNLLTIETPSGQRHEFVLTHGEDGPRILDKTELVFDKYGHDYFLSELRISGFDSGLALPRTNRERTEMRQARLTLTPQKKG